jgi:drug/metabolite transporter (DMT)-like permease
MQECRASFDDASQSDTRSPDSVDDAIVQTAAGGLAPVPLKEAPPELAAVSADRARYYKGAALALFAISIWSAWFIATRFQSTAGLGLYDMLAIRYSFTALFLLPLTWRWRHKLSTVRPLDFLFVFAGSGIAYGLSNTAAVTLSPAAEVAALTPGVMPMWAALLSVLVLGDRLSRPRLMGFGFTLLGVLAIGGMGLLHSTLAETFGHALAVFSAFLFASYTIALRRTGWTGLEAASFVGFFSSLVYLPFYFGAVTPGIWNAPASSIAVTILFQSILANIVSLIAFGRAVALIGPARAAAFAALVPALTLVLAIPFLGEFPTLVDCIGIVAITIGVYLTSGAPLPARLTRSRLLAGSTSAASPAPKER